MEYAIAREKQIKGGSRKKKLELIEDQIRNGRTCLMILRMGNNRHCEECSDEAIQGSATRLWIAARPAVARNDEESSI